MFRPNLRFILFFLILLFTIPAFGESDSLKTSGETGTIQVSLEGIRLKDKGTIVARLFATEDSWLETGSELLEQNVPASAETLVVTFESVPYDSTYGIAVIHDKNGNGEMDMRWFPFPKPKEGSGVSNNHTRKGPPKYDKARFALSEPSLLLHITMRY